MIHWTNYCSEWETESLGNLCEVNIGRTPSRRELTYWNGTHPWLSIGDMNGERRIESTKERITDLGAAESGSRLVKEGTVLLSFKLSIGKVAIAGIPLFTNEAIAALPIRDSDRLLPEYLFWVLSSIHLEDEVDKAVKGKTLNHGKIERLRIPIPHKNGKPDLEEQKRIAAILDKADAIRRKRQQALRLTDDFLRSLFLDMFGDPVTNPKGWEVGVIGDLLESANYGTSKKASTEKCEYPVLRMGNITYEGGWDFSELKYTNLEEKEKPKHLVHKGQLLFNRTNSKELVGKTAVFREDEPMAFAGYLVRGIPKTGADAEYISAYLNSRHGKETLAQMCKSIVGMANINAKEMQAIRILIPPPALQRGFGDIARSIHSKRDSWKSLDKESENLFSSLQQRAFRGEL